MSKLIIFLGNKAISCDTVVPVALALYKKKNNQNIDFYCFNQATYNFINTNTILYLAIQKVGKLKLFVSYSSKLYLRYIYKLYSGLRLLIMCFMGFLFNHKYIHFGALEKWPLKIIYYFNSKNVIYLESNCWGTNKVMLKLANLSHERNKSYVIKSANLIAGFDREWPSFINNKEKSKNILLTPSRLWEEWHDFLSDEGENIWEKECNKLEIDRDSKVVFLILGWLGPFHVYDTPETGTVLLIETLKVINETLPNISILIKPHPTTDINFIKNIMQKYEFKNTYITNLHAGLLANKSLFAICNYFSTALTDVFKTGIKTIEYSKYSKSALSITKFKSMNSQFVDYFIQSDPIKLNKVILEIINKKQLGNNMIKHKKSITDKNFIDFLCK